MFDGTDTISLYMDGSLIGTTAITQPIVADAGYLRVGYMDLTRFYTIFGRTTTATPPSMSYFWHGSIDEASMHPAALTADQVAALYASGSANGAPLPPEQADPGPPPPPPPPSAYPTTVLADTPSMYWHLGELGQPPMADASGLNRIGTYRNGLTYGQRRCTGERQRHRRRSAGHLRHRLHQPVSQPAPTTYSIEAWVKTSSFNGGKILGLRRRPDRLGRQLRPADLHDQQRSHRLRHQVRWREQVITSTTLYNNNVYHHIVATQGASGMALYVDGVLDRHQRHRDAGCLQRATGGSAAGTSPAG